MSSESNYTKKCLLDLIQRCEANDSHTAALTRYVEHLVTQQEAESNELQAQVDEMKAKMGDYEKLLELSYIALHEAGESRVLTFKISEALTSPTTTDTPEG